MLSRVDRRVELTAAGNADTTVTRVPATPIATSHGVGNPTEVNGTRIPRSVASPAACRATTMPSGTPTAEPSTPSTSVSNPRDATTPGVDAPIARTRPSSRTRAPAMTDIAE